MVNCNYYLDLEGIIREGEPDYLNFRKMWIGDPESQSFLWYMCIEAAAYMANYDELRVFMDELGLNQDNLVTFIQSTKCSPIQRLGLCLMAEKCWGLDYAEFFKDLKK